MYDTPSLYSKEMVGCYTGVQVIFRGASKMNESEAEEHWPQQPHRYAYCDLLTSLYRRQSRHRPTYQLWC